MCFCHQVQRRGFTHSVQPVRLNPVREPSSVEPAGFSRHFPTFVSEYGNRPVSTLCFSCIFSAFWTQVQKQSNRNYKDTACISRLLVLHFGVAVQFFVLFVETLWCELLLSFLQPLEHQAVWLEGLFELANNFYALSHWRVLVWLPSLRNRQARSHQQQEMNEVFCLPVPCLLWSTIPLTLTYQEDFPKG
jgi:hypothetical protein